LSPDQTHALFKVFGRLPGARPFAGVGLGLVASRKIIERLGGQIHLTGVVERGCCVTLTLFTPPASGSH